MSDFLDGFDHDSKPPSRPQKVALAFCVLAIVLVTIAATLAVEQLLTQDSYSKQGSSNEPANSGGASRPNHLPLAFGSQDVPVDSITVPAGADRSALLLFEASVEPTPTAAPRAAMVSFRVECRNSDENEPVEMQSTGKVSTNVFIARGASLAGQALTVNTDQEMECTLLAAAPFVEVMEDGLSSLPLRAEISAGSTDSLHVPALHWLDDAALFKPGTRKNVLSRRVNDPASLDSMSSTVRLTSCTVVGGSRDSDGANKCQESMTGRESSTVRVRVIARWLDDEGNISSTSTYWDETLAVDYNTHHVPWTLRQAGMADEVPDSASAVVLLVQVESLAGTPVIVHADGTDGVITTRP